MTNAKGFLKRAIALALALAMVAGMAGCAAAGSNGNPGATASDAGSNGANGANGANGSDDANGSGGTGTDADDADGASQAKLTGDLTFSVSGGLYEQEQDLSLSTTVAGGIIRYTLDGSDPTAASDVFPASLHIADRTSEPNDLSAITTGGGMGGGMGGGNWGGGNRGIPGGGDAGGKPGAIPDGGDLGAPPDGGDLGAPPDGGDLGVPPDDGNFGAPPDGGPDGDANTNTLSVDTLGNTTGNTTGGDTGVADGVMGNGNRGGMGGGRGMGGASQTPTENVFKGTVVRAAVFSASGEPLSEIATESYFICADMLSRYDLPIVSIVTDAANLFDESTGIYTNYNQSGSDWERPVSFTMFEADGTEVVSQNMGVRINGGTTRSMAQKALKFYASADYDAEAKAVEYEIFDGLTTADGEDLLTTFKRILLRSSGNDNASTLFRDALMQSLVDDLNVDTQAARPCIAFVNGEFWGIYNLRERYDDWYIATHYGVDRENVAILELSQSSTPTIEEGDETDVARYREMYAFFENNALTDDANYAKAQEYIDLDNFIDYYIANIYSGNQDWPGNNNVFWRYKTANGGYDATAPRYEDGRFRWMVKDMDWGFGLQVQVTSDTLAFALGESTTTGGMGGRGGGRGFNADWSTLFFRRLVENDDFRARFVNRFCDVMNTNYDADTVVAAIEAYASAIEGAIDEQIARYPGGIASADAWRSNVQAMVSFAQQRTAYVQGFLASRFALGDIVAMTLEVDQAAGHIRINDRDIVAGTKGVADASTWRGAYFAGTTQAFTAVPLEGHAFVKFVVTDAATGAVHEYTQAQIEVTIGSAGTSVRAVFE